MSDPFVPGTFQSKGGDWHNGKSEFAHAHAGAKTLVLEQRADNRAVVTITYQLNGKTIVERWTSDPDWPLPPPWAMAKQPVPPHPSIEPTLTDFGSVPVGEQRDALVTVRNEGSATSVPMFRLEGDGFSLPNTDKECARELNAAASCTLTVRFRPQRVGLASGALRVRLSPGPEVAAGLTGVGGTLDAAAPEGGMDGGSD
jgi:hypothetical protein